MLFRSQGTDTIHLHFDERDYQKAGRYIVEFPVAVMDVEKAQGGARVVEDSFQLQLAGKQVAAQASGGNLCMISSLASHRAVMEQYYHTAMEDIVRNTYQQSIYLAKISLIQAGPSFYIEQVENMPFGQYVFNGSLAAAMNEMTLERLDRKSVV